MSGGTGFYSESKTSGIFLSSALRRKHHKFFACLTELLSANGLSYDLLSGRNNIWVRDYMPIQVSRGCFVGFVYDPDYNKHFREQEANLRWIPEWCRERGFTCLSTPIVLDGGNVVREGNITIVTEKIFRENPGYGRRQLLRELESLLQVDRIVLVPQDSSDVFGHADGMVRFIDSGTVLANRCSAKEDRDFAAGFSKALRGAGLQIVYVPYNPYANRTTLDAKGIYINYLRTRDAVVVPVFRLKEDKEAARIIEESFPGAKLLEIEVTEIAKLGGVLNCISWTIMF